MYSIWFALYSRLEMGLVVKVTGAFPVDAVPVMFDKSLVPKNRFCGEVLAHE
jgi:hypothetical protein